MNIPEVNDLIAAERRRQNEKWGGPAHDDTHDAYEWSDYIAEHTAKALSAPPGSPEQQQRIIEVAALGDAVCACLLRLQGQVGIRAGFRPTHGDDGWWAE